MLVISKRSEPTGARSADIAFAPPIVERNVQQQSQRYAKIVAELRIRVVPLLFTGQGYRLRRKQLYTLVLPAIGKGRIRRHHF